MLLEWRYRASELAWGSRHSSLSLACEKPSNLFHAVVLRIQLRDRDTLSLQNMMHAQMPVLQYISKTSLWLFSSGKMSGKETGESMRPFSKEEDSKNIPDPF